MKKLALIDGDIISYVCASANETRSVIAEHKETLDTHTFSTATNFKEWAGEDVNAYSLKPVQTANELGYALRSVKTMIASITDSTGCDGYHVVLSGKNNFRLSLPLPTQYKDKRKESVRPLQLSSCREYLKEFHNAEVVDGIEADDALVAYAVQGLSDGDYIVQCTIDKDAYASPGWLYNWNTMDKPELVVGYGGLELAESASGITSVKGRGSSFLWFQILFGDPVDCYKPCELAKVKLGEKGVYKLLSPAKSNAESLQILANQYKKWYPTPITYRAFDGKLHTKDWIEIMQMYADCAYMRRYDGDFLNIHKLLNKYGIA